jgi:hypothetical protein
MMMIIIIMLWIAILKLKVLGVFKILNERQKKKITAAV